MTHKLATLRPLPEAHPRGTLLQRFQEANRARRARGPQPQMLVYVTMRACGSTVKNAHEMSTCVRDGFFYFLYLLAPVAAAIIVLALFCRGMSAAAKKIETGASRLWYGEP